MGDLGGENAEERGGINVETKDTKYMQGLKEDRPEQHTKHT